MSKNKLKKLIQKTQFTLIKINETPCTNLDLGVTLSLFSWLRSTNLGNRCIVKIDSVTLSFCLCHYVKMVYLIRPRKLYRRCVNQRQAPNLASDLREHINSSCYTESQALRLH